MRAKSEENNIGRRIAALRVEHGLSQTAISRRSGMDTSYLSRLETGKVHPTVRTALRIAEAMRVPIEDLVGPSPPERRSRPCPVSASGQCLMDLVEARSGAARRADAEAYSPQQIRLLRKFDTLLRRGSPGLLKALNVLLGEMVDDERGSRQGSSGGGA